MVVLPLERTLDILEVSSWFEQRQIAIPEGMTFPPTGFWIPGIAAAWLYLTNSTRAFMEDAIANPSTTADQRRQALYALESRIADEARQRGVRYLCGTSELPSMWEKLEHQGYKLSAPTYRLFGKDLSIR